MAAILHNYVINKTDGTVFETDDGFIDAYPGNPCNAAGEPMGYNPSVPAEQEERQRTLDNLPEGVSARRVAFVRIMARDAMTRPRHNIARNNDSRSQ